MYRSLRQYIQLLEREGELLRITAPVGTDCEIAEITDRISQASDGGKALLFENTPQGIPVITNMFGSKRRMALALGMQDLGEAAQRINDLFAKITAPKESLAAKLSMLPLLAEASRWLPRKVSTRSASCQQVILTGDSADLDALPILKCRALDGGRFITLPMVNTVDPDTGIRNTGMYRMQIFSRNTAGMHWHIHKTGARHFEAYRRLGKPMPVAVAIGGDPVYTYCATAPLPDNIDEYLLAGFLRRKPVRLVKCITNDICVPEDCDFVIEGFVYPDRETAVEGPFGDHTGFFSLEDRYPVLHVTAITHRRNPVYPATVVGIPPQEDAWLALATEKIFLAPIRLAIQSEIADLTMPVAGTAHNIAVAALETRYRGQAAKVAQSLWGAGQMMFNKYMLLTDSSADIRDNGTLAAILRRTDMQQRLIRSEGVLDILDHAAAQPGYGGKAAIDATGIDLSQPAEPYTFGVPHAAHGVEVEADGFIDMAEKWGAAFFFASPEADIDAFLGSAALDGLRFAIFVDLQARGLDPHELLWLAAANSDPARDIALHGPTIAVDGRSKQPGKKGNPERFPNVVVSDMQTVALVDRRWNEYGCGEFTASPSVRYRRLLLSEKAQW